MKLSRFLGTLALALAAPLVLAQSGPFTIGVTLPKTGPASHIGLAIEAGLIVGARQVNDEGGINGRKVELLVRDSGTNPQRAVLAARELVEEKKVDFLYPEVISGLTLAVLPYTTEKKVVTISMGAAARIGDPKEFPYSFMQGDAASRRPPSIAAALKKLGGTRVGILVANNPATVGTGDLLAELLPKKYGMQVVGHKQFPNETKDLTAQLQAMRDAGADIIAFDSASRDHARVVMLGMQTLGWKAKVVSGLSVLSGDMKELIPAPVHEQFYAVNHRVGTRTGTLSPEMQKFVTELRKLGPIGNIALSAEGRDVVWMIKYVQEKAQKEKGNTSNESVKAVMEAMSTVKDYPARYSLVLGNPNWSPTDHSTNNVDYSKMWGLVKVSTPVDGMYEGEELQVSD